MKYLSEISGIKDIPEVPVFFVDCKDPSGEETKTNLIQFHGWSISRKPITLNPELIRPPDDITEEETEFEAERVTEDDIEYQIIHKQRRKRIIPNNGEAISYSDWKVYQEYLEPIKKYHKETKEIECGFIERGDFRYQEIQTIERTNTIDLKTNAITYGDWHIIKKREEKIGQLIYGKEIKTIIINGKTGRHERSLWAFGLNPHTHYTLYEKTYKMEISFMIDFNGNKLYTNDWKTIPCSNTYRVLRHGKERGYSDFYERTVDENITIQYTS